MIEGALRFDDKKVADVMTPLDKVSRSLLSISSSMCMRAAFH